MKDLTLRLQNRPGALAIVGETLGKAGVSVEGGGVFSSSADHASAHFLVGDGERARSALEAAGVEVLAVRDVVTVRLDQGLPGQLGLIGRRLAEAGVNLDVQYSDHANQLILVPAEGDETKAREVAAAWAKASPRRILKELTFHTELLWTGNRGEGTRSYRGYDRSYELRSGERPLLLGSSDPTFHGDARRWSPEDLLVGALSSCHELSYLHCCATEHVVVTGYEDSAEGLMRLNADGSGELTRVTLRPRVTITAESNLETARALHERAHALCFIARSVNFEVACLPEVVVATS